MKESNRRNFFIMEFFVSSLTVFGIVMFLPMFPSLQEIFGVSIWKISWLPNVGYLTMILFSPLVGSIIKRTGHKRLLLICLLIWIGGISLEVFCIRILNYSLFIFGRFLEGIGEATFAPILLSMNNAFMKDERGSKIGASLIESGAAVGGLVSAILVGYFLNSIQTFLFIPITMGIVAWIFVLLSVKEIPLDKKHNNIEVIEEKNNTKAYVSILFMIFITQMIFVSSQVFLAYYMEIFSSSDKTGILIFLQQGMMAVGSIIAVLILKKISFIDIRNVIMAILIICSILLALQVSFMVSAVSLITLAFFLGIEFTVLNIYLTKVSTKNLPQKISLYSSIRFSAGFVLSFFWGRFIEEYISLGHSYSETFYILYISIAALAVIVFLTVYFLQKSDLSFLETKDLNNKNIRRELK